jgi:hypothetical protein
MISLQHSGTEVTARWADRELFRYVYLRSATSTPRRSG